MHKKFAFASLLILGSCMAQEPEAPSSFVFPDEWEAHEATVLIFPAHHSYGRKTRALQQESATLANTLQEHEQVIMFVHSDDEDQARALLDPKVQLHVDDAFRIDWARDNAPMIVRNTDGERRAVLFKFNGWGEKYEGWQEDVGVNKAIAKIMGWTAVHSDLVLEGGAIEIGSTDKGQTGIVTEQCVLHSNRTNWSKDRVERELKEKLGLARIVWIKRGLNPDPITDGHVDGLLKFIAKNTVLLHTTDDEADVNYKPCLDAKKRLERAGLKVIELPLADDIVHMNFYIGSGGGVVYVPVCGDRAQDEPALAILRELFDRVVPIQANAMAKAGGGVHCYTQQVPALRIPPK